jgi:hypothetical protein
MADQRQDPLQRTLISLSTRRDNFVRAFKAATADVLAFNRVNVRISVQTAGVASQYLPGRLVVLDEGNLNDAYTILRVAIANMTQQLINPDSLTGSTSQANTLPIDWALLGSVDNVNVRHIVVLEFVSLFRLMMEVIETVGPGNWVQSLRQKKFQIAPAVDRVLARPKVDFTDPRWGFAVQPRQPVNPFSPPTPAPSFNLEDFISGDFTILTPANVIAEFVHLHTHLLTSNWPSPTIPPPVASKPWTERLDDWDIYALALRSSNPLSMIAADIETLAVLTCFANNILPEGATPFVTPDLLQQRFADLSRSVASYFAERQVDKVLPIFSASVPLITTRLTLAVPGDPAPFADDARTAFREATESILDKYGPSGDTEGLMAAAAVVGTIETWNFTPIEVKREDLPSQERMAIALQRLLNLRPQIKAPVGINQINPYLALPDILTNAAFFLHRRGGGEIGPLGAIAYYHARVMLDRDYNRLIFSTGESNWLGSRAMRLPGGGVLKPKSLGSTTRLAVFRGPTDLEVQVDPSSLYRAFASGARMIDRNLAPGDQENERLFDEDEARELIDRFQREIRRIQRSLAEARVERGKEAQDVEQAELDVEVTTERLQNTQTDLDSAVERKAASDARVAELEAVRDALVNQDVVVRTLVARLGVLRERSAELEAATQARDVVQTELFAAIEKLQEAEDRTVGLQEKEAELTDLIEREERAKFLRTIVDLQVQRQDLTDRLRGLEDQRREASAAREDKRAAALQILAAERQQELEEVEEELRQEIARYGKFGITGLEQIAISNETTREQLQDRQNALDVLELARTALEDEVTALLAIAATIPKLEADATALQDKLQQSLERVAQARVRVEETSRQVQDLEEQLGPNAAEVVDTETRLADARAVAEAEEARIADLKGLSQTIQKSRSVLIARLEKEEEDVREVNERIAQLEEEKKQASEALELAKEVEEELRAARDNKEAGPSSAQLASLFGVRMGPDPNTNVKIYFTHLEELGRRVYAYIRIVVANWTPDVVAAAVRTFDEALTAYWVKGETRALGAATQTLRALLPRDPPRPIIAPRLAIVDSYCLSPSPLVL